MIRRSSTLFLLLLASTSQAFLHLPTLKQQPSTRRASSPTTTTLHATVVPSRAEGLEAIADADLTEADKMPPPSTFFECTLQVRTYLDWWGASNPPTHPHTYSHTYKTKGLQRRQCCHQGRLQAHRGGVPPAVRRRDGLPGQQCQQVTHHSTHPPTHPPSQ